MNDDDDDDGDEDGDDDGDDDDDDADAGDDGSDDGGDDPDDDDDDDHVMYMRHPLSGQVSRSRRPALPAGISPSALAMRPLPWSSTSYQRAHPPPRQLYRPAH